MFLQLPGPFFQRLQPVILMNQNAHQHRQNQEWALDGISNTQTINPEALGHSEDEQKVNLVRVMDGYFDQGAHHLNVNVFGREKLVDAMEHPEKEEYANFTIRVSGYAVKFIDLTREQQLDVIARTCHDRM